MGSPTTVNPPVVLLAVSFRQLCLATVSLPLGSLLICFVTAYTFQQDDIHETYCRVYNVIPSISSITGVSPQRYLWRISVAFHIGPRLIIASVYYAHYRNVIMQLEPARRCALLRHLQAAYWLYMAEIAALCGVTYVSNRENYPLHEKIFIVFMVASLTYMLMLLRLIRAARPEMTPIEIHSYRVKKILFSVSIASTVGLLLFFLKHRLLCHDMAFSWFSLCEYVIASCNMAFHVTAIFDFPSEQLIVANGLEFLKSEAVKRQSQSPAPTTTPAAAPTTQVHPKGD